MERAGNVAFNERAPHDERADANSQLQQTHAPASRGELIPADALNPIIQMFKSGADAWREEEEFLKASRQNLIRLPSAAKIKRTDGMQSVYLDNMQINLMGEYYERPGMFTFDAMRSMVDQTPILSAVILTRQRQIQRFCRPQKDNRPGFQIRLKDRDAHPSRSEKKEIELIESFFMNCGWETDARTRMRLKRDNFTTFMMKLVRDTLTMDSMPIETEFKRDRSKGIDGMYAVDGATIRLCSEDGYHGEDEIYALQVIQGQIRSVYNYDQLIYVPRNPRSDVTIGGYGMAETELLVRVVTGFLNAFTYNTKYFDTNSIPKGILHLSGSYTDNDLSAFKRYWNAMVRGVNNAWTLPVMVSKDQESKAAFEKFGVEVDEMMFGRWMTFLTSLICAIYGIAPDEINFESFGMNKSSLSGNDTQEKIDASKDKGLLPLLAYFDNTFTDFIVCGFSDKYEFEWTGIDPEDTKQKFEELKLCGTVNELRASRGEEKITEPWGDAPLNSSLISVWQSHQESQNKDFGIPIEDEDPKLSDRIKVGKDFGTPDADPEGDADDRYFGKSFGMPALKIEV